MQHIKNIRYKVCRHFKNNKKIFAGFIFITIIFLNAFGNYNFPNGGKSAKNKNCTGIIDRIEEDKLVIECSNKKIIYYPCKNLHGLKEGDCVKINNDKIKLNLKLNKNRKNKINKLYNSLQIR